MELQSIKSYIKEEKEFEYVLNLWEPMLKSWNIKQDNDLEWQAFLSKMMEIERACVEVDDQRPIVTIKKDFSECRVTITKNNQLSRRTYILQPYGFQNNWEIFKVDREEQI